MAADSLSQLPAEYVRVVRGRRSRERRLAIAVCYLAPVVLAALAVLSEAQLPQGSALLAGVSIFGGFMFTILMTILRKSFDLHSLATSIGLDKSGQRQRDAFLPLETTVSYAVLVAVSTTFLLIAGEIAVDYTRLGSFVGDLSGFLQERVYVPLAAALTAHLLGLFVVILQDLHIVSSKLLRDAGVQPDPKKLPTPGPGVSIPQPETQVTARTD